MNELELAEKYHELDRKYYKRFRRCYPIAFGSNPTYEELIQGIQKCLDEDRPAESPPVMECVLDENGKPPWIN